MFSSSPCGSWNSTELSPQAALPWCLGASSPAWGVPLPSPSSCPPCSPGSFSASFQLGLPNSFFPAPDQQPWPRGLFLGPCIPAPWRSHLLSSPWQLPFTCLRGGSLSILKTALVTEGHVTMRVLCSREHPIYTRARWCEPGFLLPHLSLPPASGPPLRCRCKCHSVINLNPMSGKPESFCGALFINSG